MAWSVKWCHYVTVIVVFCLMPYDIAGYGLRTSNHHKRATKEQIDDAELAQQQQKPLYSFDLENSYKSEIEALDKEYSIPIAYKMEPKIAPAENEKIEKEATEEQAYVSKKPARRRHHKKSKPTPSKEYNYDSSSNIEASQPSKPIDPSNCEEIEKDNMKCVICNDKKNGGKSKTCSYSATQKPKEYHHHKSSKYTKPSKMVDLRYKREPKKAVEMDPYEQFKAESQAAAEYEPKEGYFHEYKLPEDYFQGDNQEKSESEDHVSKLMKDGADCKEVKKDDMTCTVCKNDKNGGTYEKCSYSMIPKEKKYAFSKEIKSDGQKSDDNSKNDSAGNKDNLKKQASENVPQRTSSSSSKNNNNKHDDDNNYESEKQSDKSDKEVDDVLMEFSKKDRSACKKSEKNGMTCYLCVDKNGGKHEECMFVSGNQKN